MTAARTALFPDLGPIDLDAVAIATSAQAPLSHRALATFVSETAGALAAFGIGTGDVVAYVLPNGPQAATCFLSVSACACAAPLNPAYRQEEFSFYLGDLQAKALLCAAGAFEPVRLAAASLGIPVIDVVPSAEAAGLFSLALAGGVRLPAARTERLNRADDIGLILHTSGTTARPKIVGLTQANIHASMANIAATLELTPADRCLNVMPLFHIHGLVAALGASLAAGGSTVCTPGFNALRFEAWLSEFGPTWYTAVPTMHQLIVERLGKNEPRPASKLRFVRSSSAALPATAFHALRATFGCPVVEAYGMTEAAHQMSSNTLQQGGQTPGSVGWPAGPEMTVLDAAGAPARTGTKGEIAVRGQNVHAGYLGNPQANRDSFVGGWFRTGDQGFVDADGRLFITGRLKELINRGGEKISPLEVDEVLLSHPDVAQAVTFAIPHEKLGEEVAAAIVLREGARPGEAAVRDYVRARIAHFKTPRRIVFLDEIPKGPTGKIQRIGLAEKLGLVGKA